MSDDVSIGAPTSSPRTTLTWGLAIATFDRRETLLETIGYALQQSRPPVEIVICDSSSDWSQTADDVRRLIAAHHADVRLWYGAAPTAQQTIQRNCAIDHATADVLFMIDDDAFLQRDAAEHTMRVYEAPGAQDVIAVGIGFMQDWKGLDAPVGERNAYTGSAPLRQRLGAFLFGYWTWARPRQGKHFVLPRVDLPIEGLPCLCGAQITVRRDVIAKVRFDEHLVSGLFEDYDATFRLSKIGTVLELQEPLLYHAVAPRRGDQHRRGITARFGWILHLAYLNRRYFGDGMYVKLFCLIQWARLASLDLLVGLARRSFDRFIGCLYALPAILRLTAAPQAEIGNVVVRETRSFRNRLAARERRRNVKPMTETNEMRGAHAAASDS
jgi:GT2 family glycosyltransferase